MPIEVGDPVTAELLDLMANPPTVSLVQQSAQSAASNTTFAITYGTGSTVLDTDDFHSESTNNTRITPTRAGVYAISAKAFFGAEDTFRIVDSILRLNGTTIVAGSSGRRLSGGTGSATFNSADTGVVYVTFNGTTDYVEHLCVQTNADATNTNTATSGQFASTFNLTYHRES